MKPSVAVKFRRAIDYSNEHKDKIIGALPGTYKVPREKLNDMDKCGEHIFEFGHEDVASGFALELFTEHNNIFDVRAVNFAIRK